MTNREMDAQIAEKVMNIPPVLSWECLDADESNTCITFETKQEGEQWLAKQQREFPGGFYADRHIGAWKHYPRYSTDPAASKQLREKLAEKRIWAMFQTPTEFRFYTYDDTGVAVSFFGVAETEELAVALAALKSVGIQ